jgi:hypothetical protein
MKEVYMIQALEGGKAKKLTEWTKVSYP